MKAERVKVVPFYPIVLTLESQAEADHMRASLNVSQVDIMKHNSSHVFNERVQMDMWDKFSDTYDNNNPS
ncbi:MAG: hypothetical protein ACXABY_03575 [Candidatus Thorarchaeota archaeon]|jgi:hypothetical protein